MPHLTCSKLAIALLACALFVPVAFAQERAIEAPLLLDAASAFRRARPFDAASLERSVAICQIGFRPRSRGGPLERAASVIAGVATVGISTAIENAEDPDLAGIDLALGARFGRGPLYTARGAWDAHRSFVTFPVASIRAGDPVWLRLRDVDAFSADEVLGEWSFAWDGSSPLVARHGRASVECRFLPAREVERRVGESVARANAAIARLERGAASEATRVAAARNPRELLRPAFDVQAERAAEHLAIARANTSDPTSWPELAEAERAFTTAIEPVAAARRAWIASRPIDPGAPSFHAVALCNATPATVLLTLHVGEDAPRPPRTPEAWALDGRGLVRRVQLGPTSSSEPNVVAAGRIEGFDRGGFRACEAPRALLVGSGARSFVARPRS